MRSSANFVKLSGAILVIALFIVGGMGMNVQAGPSAQATGSATAASGGAAGGTTGSTNGMRFAECGANSAGGTTGGAQATSAAGGATMNATTSAGGTTGSSGIPQNIANQFLTWIESHNPGDTVVLTVQRRSTANSMTGTSGSTGAQATSAAGGATMNATDSGGTGGAQATSAVGGTSGNAGNRTAYLGIRGAAVDNCGVSVLEVFAGSPAEAAGLWIGDVIVAVDGMALASLPSNMASGNSAGGTSGTTGGAQATSEAGGATMSATESGGSTGGAQATSAAGGTTGTNVGSSNVEEIDLTVTLGALPPGVVPSTGAGVATAAPTANK